MSRYKRLAAPLLIGLTLFVATNSFADQAQRDKDRDKARCEKLLDLLDKDLKAAKADIIADAGPISHATALLAGASISYQFARFKGCIDKTTRGRKIVAPYVVKKSKNKSL